MLFFVICTSIFAVATAHVVPSLTNSLSKHPRLHLRQASNPRIGSYIMTWKPSDSNMSLYKGPMRITSDNAGTIISGDLYNGTVDPNPVNGSPILPRTNYWAYVRATKFTPGNNGAFSLDLEHYKFAGFDPKPAINFTKFEEHAYAGGMTVTLAPTTAPSGYPDSKNYFEGEVKFVSNGSSAGHMTIGWVSTYLRRFTLEAGAVSGIQVPKTDSSGTRDWKTIYDEVSIDLTFEIGKTDIPEPDGGEWTAEQMQTAVVQYRNPKTDLDKEWRGYLLFVKKARGVPRGWGFDQGSEWNQTPREGCVVVSDAPVVDPNDKLPWPESVKGKRFGELYDAWYRTALHEVGHSFNLPHPYNFTNDIMTDTPEYVLAGAQNKTARPFPENITPASLRFSEHDRIYVAHRSDLHVRPGVSEFGAAIDDATPPVAQPL